MRFVSAVLIRSVLLAGGLAGQEPSARPLTILELEALARRDSNDAMTHYRLALAYWDKKQWDAAERALHQALVVAPGYADAHLALAILPIQRGEGYWKGRVKVEGEEKVKAAFLESESHYRRAFLLNPLVDLRVLGKFENQELGVYQVGKRMYLVIPPWWSKDLTKSANEFREGRYEKAFEHLSGLVRDKRFGGQDVDVAGPVLWFHGLAAAHLDSFDLAIRDFAILTGRAVADEQDTTRPLDQSVPLRSNDYRFVLATMLYLAGRYNQAIPVFRRVLELDLGQYVAHVQLARMAELGGRLDEALQERRLALDVSQDDPDLLVDLAATLLKAGQPAEAQASLADAAHFNPRDARIPLLQALTAETLDQPDSARAAYERFLAIAPSRFATQIAESRKRLAELP
jgi:tetratricopeptide (TPR) repeat protein